MILLYSRRTSSNWSAQKCYAKNDILILICCGYFLNYNRISTRFLPSNEIPLWRIKVFNMSQLHRKLKDFLPSQLQILVPLKPEALWWTSLAIRNGDTLYPLFMLSNISIVPVVLDWFETLGKNSSENTPGYLIAYFEGRSWERNTKFLVLDLGSVMSSLCTKY